MLFANVRQLLRNSLWGRRKGRAGAKTSRPVLILRKINDVAILAKSRFFLEKFFLVEGFLSL